MSKIKQLLQSNDSILVFDIDGVLALMEFGEYNHFLTDEEWEKTLKDNINYYTEEKISPKIQKYLKTKDINKIYVISKVNDINEINQKKEYCNKYYNIPKDNVYTVDKDEEKASILTKIKDNYPNIPNHDIVMIDDSVIVLNDVMNKTNFSTVHISSLLNIID